VIFFLNAILAAARKEGSLSPLEGKIAAFLDAAHLKTWIAAKSLPPSSFLLMEVPFPRRWIGWNFFPSQNGGCPLPSPGNPRSDSRLLGPSLFPKAIPVFLLQRILFPTVFLPYACDPLRP